MPLSKAACTRLSKRLGASLKAAREAAGLTQADVVARLGGGSRQVVSEIENGGRQPSVNRLEELSIIYDRPLEELFGGVHSRRKP